MYKQIKASIKPLFGEDLETYKKVKAEVKKILAKEPPKFTSDQVEYLKSLGLDTTKLASKNKIDFFTGEQRKYLESLGFKVGKKRADWNDDSGDYGVLVSPGKSFDNKWELYIGVFDTKDDGIYIPGNPNKEDIIKAVDQAIRKAKDKNTKKRLKQVFHPELGRE